MNGGGTEARIPAGPPLLFNVYGFFIFLFFLMLPLVESMNGQMCQQQRMMASAWIGANWHPFTRQPVSLQNCEMLPGLFFVLVFFFPSLSDEILMDLTCC